METDGDILGEIETEAEGDMETEGEVDGLILIEGETDGETETPPLGD